ncbi:MAG: hypothetical protein ACTS22_08585 [Phycisphaerales bacterium]
MTAGLAAAIAVVAVGARAQTLEQTALDENRAGVRAYYQGDSEGALIRFATAYQTAQTPLVRITARVNSVAALTDAGQVGDAIALAASILDDPESGLVEVQHIMPDLYRHLGDAYRSIGDHDTAITIRAAGIDALSTKIHQSSVAVKLAPLYFENAQDARAVGDTSLVKHWYDRLFAEHPDFGYEANEERESYRSRALTLSGLDDDSPEYAARARELADMPGLYPGRATPWLLSMVNWQHVQDRNRQGQRDIAAEVFAGSIAHGWHQKHDEYRFPSLLSEWRTTKTREEVASLLVNAATMRPETTEEVDENYLYALFILQELGDLAYVKQFKAQLTQITRTYELHLGDGNPLGPG